MPNRRKIKTASFAFWICWILAIGLLLYITYGQYLRNPLVFDDIYFFDGKSHKKYLNHIFEFELRWLPYATFAWTRAIGNWDLQWFRLGNVVIHFLNCILLTKFITQLLNASDSGNRENAKTNNNLLISCCVSSIFAMHPVGVYAVAYLTQRSTLLATTFTLATLLFATRAILDGHIRWMIASVIAYFLAVMSKEHAIMSPGLVIALTILYRRRVAISRYSCFLALAAYIAIAFFAVYKLQAGNSVIGQAYQVNGKSLIQRLLIQNPQFNTQNAFFLSIITQATLYFKYLACWLIPDPSAMSIDMYEPLANRLDDLSRLFGLIAYCAYGAASIALLCKGGKKGLIGFGLLCPWLLFFTEFSTVRVAEPFVLYRSYLWFSGSFIALSVVASQLRAALLLPVAIATMITLIPITLLNLHSFSDSVNLWNGAAQLIEGKRFIPGMERIYFNRANALSQRGEYKKSIQDYDLTIKFDPTLAEAYSDRGAAKFGLKDYVGAQADFTTALSIKPNLSLSHLGLAKIYELRGDLTNAAKSFRAACVTGRIEACNKGAAG